MTKVLSKIMLVLPNVTVKFEEKNRVPLNVTKVWSEVMWVLPNVIMERSNLRIKK